MLISVLMCNFSKYLPLTNICGKFYPKICCSSYLLKFSIKIRCNSSIWRKQDGMKFAHNTLKFSRFVQNYMNDKTFEKINIKIEISIQQSTSVLNFSQFEELQINETKFAQKRLQGVVLGQTQPENNQFQVKNTIKWLVFGGFRQFLGGFSWFQVVPSFSKYVKSKLFTRLTLAWQCTEADICRCFRREVFLKIS